MLFLTCNMKSYSQTKISLNKYYKGCGVVFDSIDTNSLYFRIPYFKKPFTPSLNELENTENLLNHFIEEKFKELYKELKFYNRQYLCFINENNEMNIIVILLNFKNKRKASRNFKGWMNEITLGLGKFYEENQLIIRVNLDKKEVSIF